MVGKDNIFFPINGGLGDAYKGYWSYTPYGKLEAFKKKYGCKIKFIICSHNPLTAGFYEYHPDIDIVESYPAIKRNPGDKSPAELIRDKYGKDYTWANTYFKDFNKLPYTKPIVYLKDQKEKDFVEDITSRGKYICIHPFAGGVIRGVPNLDTYYKIALRIKKDLDCNTVILGGSYKRVTERGTRVTEEIFPYAGDRMINLMNQTNGRTAAEITQNAAGFVGTWSCFLCAILKTKMRGVTFIPAGRPALIRGGTYKYLSKEIKPLFIDKNTNSAQVIDNTINWLKGHI